MTVHNYTNTASTAQLDAPLNSSATSFQVTGLTGYPSAPFFILMDRDTSSAELMEVTQVAGSTLTVLRGAGGTASTPHSSGATVEHVIPAAVPQAAEAHIEASTNVHGVTGALVGATNEGTLSNKTFRGAHRHVYSDTLPAGPAAGFIVEADTSISRDGFVAAGSAANTDRRGFLLTQAGADRFEARYDGTVKITPSGATSRPGLEVTTSIQTDDLVVTDDLTVEGSASVLQDFSAQTVTTANANVSSGLAVTGTSQMAQVNASGTVTAGGSGTGLVVTNDAAVGNNASVGGNVTMSGSAKTLKLSTGHSASTPGTATGQVRYRGGGIEAWNGEKWTTTLGGGGFFTQSAFDGGTVSATRTRLESTTIPGYGTGVPYYVLSMAQCEINDPTPGSRFDLFLVGGDDWTDDDLTFAVGLGPGFAQTGMGIWYQPNGGAVDIHMVVRRSVGGSGSATVTAFNQMFAAFQIPSLG